MILLAFILGSCAGAAYDLLAQVRCRVRWRASRAALTALFDAIFCVLCAAAFFLLAHGPGGGQLRLGLLLFVTLGGLLYHITLSRFVSTLFGYALDGLIFTVRLLARVIAFPFVITKRFLSFCTKKTKKRLLYLRKWFTIEKKFNVR